MSPSWALLCLYGGRELGAAEPSGPPPPLASCTAVTSGKGKSRAGALTPLKPHACPGQVPLNLGWHICGRPLAAPLPYPWGLAGSSCWWSLAGTVPWPSRPEVSTVLACGHAVSDRSDPQLRRRTEQGAVRSDAYSFPTDSPCPGQWMRAGGGRGAGGRGGGPSGRLAGMNLEAVRLLLQAVETTVQ